MGDAGLAEEITQAVFVILARKAGSLGDKTILPGWLCRTARYASANALTIQRRRRQREQEAFMQNILTGGSDASSQSDETWRQIAPLLEAALDNLGHKDHDAVVLRFFQNKNFSEVGAALGASEDAAKMRVSRALEKLRKFFMKRGVDSTASAIAEQISANSIQAAPVALAKAVTAVAIAKGATASISTLTLIKGALKNMAWTKAKTSIISGVGVALLLAGGAITLSVAKKSAGDKLTAVEILRKVQANYDALATYSDSGENISKSPGRSLTTTFAVKFARPDLYIIQNTQSVGKTSHTATIWPAEGQIFALVDQTKYFRFAENENHDPIYESSTGSSAASGLSAIGLFYHKKSLGSQWRGSIEELAASTNLVRQPDERVAGVNCYVLKMPVSFLNTTLWIGQNDFLIHQRRMVAVSSEDPKDTNEITEIHTDIEINKVFSKADLTPRIPAGVKLETKPLR